MDLQDLISLALLATGGLTLAAGLTLVVRNEVLRQPDGPPSNAAVVPRGRGVWLIVAALAIVAVVVALEGVERRGMSHVEVYVPNIDLPDGVSEPPPRQGIAELVWWHWHIEPHPQGYYFGMWAWTKAFGTSLLALRLPGVLFGGLAVVLIFLVGSHLYGATAGVIAAGLLALNGHHIYWMQQARMYEPSLAIGLLSLWLWLRLLRRERSPPGEELGYVAATAAGTYLQVYFWPFLAGQMAYTLFGAPGRRPDGRRRVHRVFGLQSLAVLLGTPMWAHAIYRAYSQPQDGTTLAYLQDFFNFGFLFQPEDWSTIPRNVTGGIEWAATAVAVVALVMFFSRRKANWSPAPSGRPIPVRSLIPVAVGFAMVLLALGREAYQRNLEVSLSGLMPLVVLGNLALWSFVWRGGAANEDSAVESGEPARAYPVLGVLALSSAIVFGIGLAVPFLVSRGLLVIVPALLLVLGAGLATLLERQRWVGSAALVVVAGLSVYSIDYFRGIPGPNDYRGLAEQMVDDIEPGDRIFVPERDWVTTPIYYHLPNTFDQLVANDYEAVEADTDVDRVWLLRFSEIPTPQPMWDGLATFQPVDSVTAHNAVAILFERRPSDPVTQSDGSP